MARQYTQVKRFQNSYNTYVNKVKALAEKNAVLEPLKPEQYRRIYDQARAEGVKNIARQTAAHYNVITTATEARAIRERIKAEYGEENIDEFYSVKELQKLTGEELWTYLKDLGLSDREAGAWYDGEREYIDESTGEIKTIKTSRVRRSTL